MKKSYAIAEIANLLDKTDRLAFNKNEPIHPQVARSMFDDLETIFKIYLDTAQEKVDAELMLEEANCALDNAEKACIKYELQIKKLTEEPKIEIPKEITLKFSAVDRKLLLKGFMASGNMQLSTESQDTIIETHNKL